MGTVAKVLLGVVLGGLVLIGGCVALIGVIGSDVADQVDQQAEQRDEEVRDDITITDCGEVNEFGLIETTGTIINDSADRSSYSVTIEYFDEGGTRVGESNAFSNAVGSGTTAELRASGSVPAGASIARCEIADVTRFSAES